MASNKQLLIDDELTLSLIANAALGNGTPNEEACDLSVLSRNRKENPMVLIACTTRACSTFLGNVLGKIAHLTWFRYCSAYYNVENDLYLPALCIADRAPTVSVLHMRATYPSCYLINVFGIKTIVNVRNIYDNVASMANCYSSRRIHPNYDLGYSSPSMVWIDKNHHKISDDQLLDVMIDFFAPWYIQFYVSWYTVIERHEVNAMWISYEEIKRDTDSAIQSILDFCGLEAHNKDWSSIYEQFPPSSEEFRDINNEKPRSYWLEKLTPERRSKIQKLASYYPDVDFSRIGL